jgi:hypothetical protein
MTFALRAFALTLGKEARLLWRDRVGLFMLLVAPIAVIAAAGFSLANIYGAAPRGTIYTLAVLDEDHGAVAHAVLNALDSHPGLRIIVAHDRTAARDLVIKNRRALLALIIPAGVTAALARGNNPDLVLITDPVRYLQTVRLEVALDTLCRRVNAQAASRSRAALAAQAAMVRRNLAQATAQMRSLRAQFEQLRRAARANQQAARAKLQKQLDQLSVRMQTQLRDALSNALAPLDQQLQASSQLAARNELRTYLVRLAAVRGQFDRWFAQLKAHAGSRASEIPPPPDFPEPPAALTRLLGTPLPSISSHALEAHLLDSARLRLPKIQLPAEFTRFVLPSLPEIALPPLDGGIAVPGNLGLLDESAAGDHDAAKRGFNAFDLQVPGFAITFLLIGMLIGLALALLDERDWGALTRLQASSALYPALAGKVFARFVIGLVQLIVLFAIGASAFDMALGPHPAALLAPAAAVAFAAAGFGLIVASVGRSRDAVLPLGAILIMTMAAMGGCWWPLDFEPPWMQTVALALPTTWAMRAFNDLMIRDLPASAAALPTLVNLGFGILYAAIGAALARRRFA